MAEVIEAKGLSAQSTKKTNTLKPHTRRVIREEKIGKGILWFFAWLTVMVLVLIVGYIVVNGLYTRTVTTDRVTPVVQEEVPLIGLPNTGVENENEQKPAFSVIAPRGLRLNDLTYSQLRELFAGLESYLGYITKQHVSATTVVYSDGRFEKQIGEYLLLGNQYETKLDDKTIHVRSKEELLQAVNAFEGTIAIVPSKMAQDIKNAKTIGIRQISVAVHNDITELQRGRRLDVLTMKQTEKLLKQEYSDWAAAGGPSIEITPAKPKEGIEGEYTPLPVIPVSLLRDTALGRELTQVLPWSNESKKIVNTPEEFAKVIRETPGAIGAIRAREASQLNLNLIEIERVTHARNLRLATIIEPPRRAGAVGGLSTIILNTVAMVLFVILITTPLGVAAAIYLAEYAHEGPMLKALRIGTDTLAGVPSIIFGLFGMVFFAEFLGFKTGLLSGTLTLTLMVLPTVVRTSEEAIKAVPRTLKEGSFALGATKIQTIFRVVLPSALPGIATGMILAIGRAVGETAALLFTMGSNLALLRSFNSPIRVLSVHLYMLIRENISFSNAFAAALLLILIVFIVNSLTNSLIRRSEEHA